MADFFTQFSCILDVGTAENALLAEAIRGELAADLNRDEGGYPGFSMAVDHETGPGALWIYSDEYGEPAHVIQFVLRCAEQLCLKGLWGFTWSLSCSKPRVGCFGGGAYALDLGTGTAIADIDCHDWLSRFTAPPAEDDAKTALDFIAGQGGESLSANSSISPALTIQRKHGPGWTDNWPTISTAIQVTGTPH